MKTVHIIYASTSGNVELVCEKIESVLKNNHIEVQMHRAEITDISVFDRSDFFVLATSTWEHGEINPFFNELLIQMKKYDFSGKYAGFVGLGDIRYEPVLFCKGLDELKEVFTDNNGVELGGTVKINGEPHEILDTTVKNWAQKFLDELVKFE